MSQSLQDDAGVPERRHLPPPMRIVREGLFTYYVLTKAEAEAYHLRAAAKLAGSLERDDQQAYDHHLREAACNRAWRLSTVAVPSRSACGVSPTTEGTVNKGGRNEVFQITERPPPPAPLRRK